MSEKDFLWSAVTGMREYLRLLNAEKERLLILVAVKDSVGFNVPQDVRELFAGLGLTETPRHWHSYLAVVDGGKQVVERTSKYDEQLLWTGLLEGKKVFLLSETWKKGNHVRILIDHKEYAADFRGYNIVVYDKAAGVVVDSLCFDTMQAHIPCFRKQAGDELSAVKQVELDMLKELIRVCDKYGLRYCAGGGTLIGAVRHGGFIPWDDDIDIEMPRADYEKLKAAAVEEFKPPYFFQTAGTDNYRFLEHAQIRNIETLGIIERQFGRKFNTGIFIDIFPFDNIPDNEPELDEFINQIKAYHYVYYTDLYCAGAMSNKELYAGFEKLCTKYNGIQTRRIAPVSFLPGAVELYRRREWYAELIKMPFEDTEISVPIGYDDILSAQFGDWMTERRESSRHDGIVFDTEMPYDEAVKIFDNKIFQHVYAAKSRYQDELENTKINLDTHIEECNFLQNECGKLRTELNDARNRLQNIESGAKKMENELFENRERLQSIEAGASFRLGLKLTWLPRKIRDMLKRMR